ncbi:hypothetical protein EYF80_024883 [Liparis tanakae]|uniref:Uncharacterized protein n=1 Tax=Liparis tanakae TaxID=230148 RepID=A0A4Z2HHY9_9TELE|nr:hypothetical protein EYF80_024883 [Liparis tanakae]
MSSEILQAIPLAAGETGMQQGVGLIEEKATEILGRRSASEMLPVDIWTTAGVLQPSHMDVLGYKLTNKLLDL